MSNQKQLLKLVELRDNAIARGDQKLAESINQRLSQVKATTRTSNHETRNHFETR